MTTPPAESARAPLPLTAIARHPWWTALAVLVVAIVVLLILWDWNWFKGPIERQVHARTGRSFDIGGDLDVDLGRVTTIRAEALRFGNAPWSKDPTMASADHVEFGIEVWPLLLHRQVRIPDIHLTKARLRLEKSPGGVGNWVFGKKSNRQQEFGRLWLDDGRLRFIDAAAKTDIDIAVDSTAPSKDAAAPTIDVKGGGRWQDNSFSVRGRAESPLALRDKLRPYRIDARAQAGATRAHARGTLLDPLQLRDFDLKLALSGGSMEDMYPLFGIASPPSRPYSLDGHFTRERKGDISVWHYDDFSGNVGDSDLAGDASVTTGGARPYLRANLVSRRLEFRDLAGFIGRKPGAATPPQTTGRVLPSAPYDLKKLRAMDADVRWKAHRIDAPKLPLDDMDAHLKLENGLLQLIPLNFGVAGGDIRSDIRMDGRESPIRTRADITARGLNLGSLLPDVKLASDAVGKVGGKIAVTGSGNSIAKMLATSDGNIAVGMGRGQVSNLLMEYAGLDIAEALKFMIRGDRRIPVRCAFGDFSVANGVMTTRALAFDTTDTIIIGQGNINLRDETLNLRLRPRPKDRSLFVLRSPLIVDGTFKDPDFHPDLARAGLRGALALVLGSIAPPAALLATLEFGPGENANCGGRYAK